MKITTAKNKQWPHHIDVLSMLFGCLLGDGHGEIRSKKRTVRFSLQQENSNVEYLMWFHKFLASRGYCCMKQPKLYKRIGKRNKVRFYYRINTYSFANLVWFYDAFYVHGPENTRVKKVPDRDFLELYLTPLAIAVWFMEDGSVSSAGAKIATNSFNLEDLQRVKEFFLSKYNIECSIQSAGAAGQHVLYFYKRSMPRLSKLIKKYMVSSMHYKLNSY